MGLRGAQPAILPKSVAAVRFGKLVIAARLKGILVTKECGYIYTLKGAIAGHPVLMESLDIEAIELAVEFTQDVEYWSAHLVRCYIRQARQLKERIKNEAENKRSH